MCLCPIAEQGKVLHASSAMGLDMGKNNSVKKIDEEQILKRFEYTVQEYIRFYDFYKNQEV